MPYTISNFRIPLEELQAKQSEEAPSPSSFRPVCFKASLFDNKKGSSYVEFGSTRVLAQVVGPCEDSSGDFYEAQIKVVFSGCDEVEMRAQLIGAMRGLVQLHLYAKSLITIHITVLADDGGVLQAALIAASMAIIDAGIEVLDVCVSCEVAVLPDSTLVVDPKKSQERKATLTVALMPNLNQIICVDSVGAMTLDDYSSALELALSKAVRLYPLLRKALVQEVDKE